MCNNRENCGCQRRGRRGRRGCQGIPGIPGNLSKDICNMGFTGKDPNPMSMTPIIEQFDENVIIDEFKSRIVGTRIDNLVTITFAFKVPIIRTLTTSTIFVVNTQYLLNQASVAGLFKMPTYLQGPKGSEADYEMPFVVSSGPISDSKNAFVLVSFGNSGSFAVIANPGLVPPGLTYGIDFSLSYFVSDN